MSAVRSIILAVVSFVFLAGVAFAQSGVLDWNATSTPFTAQQYSALLTCTLEEHPDETKRYASYHLLRRDRQTPDENGRDPDSRLIMPSLDGCYLPVSGKPFPFSLDRLINDWGQAHGIARGASEEVIDIQSLANCAAKHNPSQARAYIRAVDTSMQPKYLKLAMFALGSPPCVLSRDPKIDHAKFRELVQNALNKNEARR